MASLKLPRVEIPNLYYTRIHLVSMDTNILISQFCETHDLNLICFHRAGLYNEVCGRALI